METNANPINTWIERPAANAEGSIRDGRQAFADKVISSGIEQAVEWAADQLVAEIELGVWARVQRRIDNDVHPVEALEAEVNRCERELLEDYHRSTSSSMLSNAVSEATRQAFSRFASRGRGILESV